MPTSRPNLKLNEDGVCSACVNAGEKEDIDWGKREKELQAIFDKFRAKDEAKYDCIVPVSGGKDSIYQVHVIKNVYNMHPLCVTFRTDARTPLGEKNLQSLREMGVDHIDFTPNPIAFRKLRRKCFEEVGDCSLPDHLAIWSVVPRLAVNFNIPLIIWGENPDMEYGGADTKNIPFLNRQWLKSQDILKNKKLEDWTDDNLKLKDLSSLIYPSEEELDKLGYCPIFLGYYLPWDCETNIRISREYGFKERNEPVMGLYTYADLDCMYIVIHHYMKWLKFGYNRITDNASHEIRHGRMTREDAVKLVRERDGIKPPKEYIEHVCRHMGITEEHFWEVLEKFRNKDIWTQDENGEWYIDGWIGGEKAPDRFGHAKSE